MSIAVKFGDLLNPEELSGFIYLDAVTAYTKTYDGRVTEHPLESGVSITDHFVSSNPKFRITGVISGVDLSPIPLMIFMDGESPMNSQKTVAQPVTVNDTGSGLNRFLPDTIRQFMPKTQPQVVAESERENFSEIVETFLETIMTGIQFNERSNRYQSMMSLATIYEMNGSQFGRSHSNCVLTSFNLSETVESGEGLFLELSFEKVRFADSEVAEAPKPEKKTSTARGTSSKKNKGTTTAKDTTPETAPKSAPTPPKPNRAFSTDPAP